MQSKFEERFLSWWDHKKVHYILESEEDRNKRIHVLRRVDSGEILDMQERNWAKTYSIRQTGDSFELTHLNRRVLIRSEVFGILHEAHCRLGPAGRNIMHHELKAHYGLSLDIINIYLSECEECAMKRGKAKKSVVVKLIISGNYNSRCQVDLIDLQSRPDSEYKLSKVFFANCIKCVSNRCGCKKASRMCNSRCHSSRNCSNKC